MEIATANPRSARTAERGATRPKVLLALGVALVGLGLGYLTTIGFGKAGPIHRAAQVMALVGLILVICANWRAWRTRRRRGQPSAHG